ncbi:hypothetical protein C8R45DRAFT_922002 [Mycena sanguinolenta]|nr:hypothetical protein C8R45DRAFT_922002 [Mycena sanguinolenta]
MAKGLTFLLLLAPSRRKLFPVQHNIARMGLRSTRALAACATTLSIHIAQAETSKEPEDAHPRQVFSLAVDQTYWRGKGALLSPVPPTEFDQVYKGQFQDKDPVTAEDKDI